MFVLVVDLVDVIGNPGLPYLKFLRRESGGSEVRHADFARLQRESLEDYLINLIRAVVCSFRKIVIVLNASNIRCFILLRIGSQVFWRSVTYS